MDATLRARGIFLLVVVVVASSVLAGGRATGTLAADESDDDGVPSGTVAFFSVDEGSGCPAGWLWRATSPSGSSSA